MPGLGPTWWCGGLAQCGTGWWSWSPPDPALDSGIGLFHREDLGYCTDSQYFLPSSPLHSSPGPWAPVQLPCCQPCAAPKTSLPHLAEGDLKNLVARVTVGWGPSCPVTQLPPRPPLPLRHGGVVPWPDPHTAPSVCSVPETEPKETLQGLPGDVFVPWPPHRAQSLQPALAPSPQEPLCHPGPRDLLLFHLLQRKGQHW